VKNLPIYSTLEEKRIAFKNIIEIREEADVDYWLLGCKNYPGFVFRGVSNSRYKLYNTAQRFWITDSSQSLKDSKKYHQFIISSIKTARDINRETIKKYFSNFGFEDDDFAILSFIQHYGGYTPLLDLTHSFEVALFFACSKVKLIYTNVEESSENDLDSYVSIYVFHPDIIRLFNTMEPVRGLIRQFGNDTHIQNIKKYEAHYFNEIPIMIIKNEKVEKELAFNLYNNLNISNQQGLFVYNNSSYLSLEENMLQLKNGYEGFNGTSDTSTWISCIHLHKNLIPHVLKRLGEQQITDDFIFPDAKSMISKIATIAEKS